MNAQFCSITSNSSTPSNRVFAIFLLAFFCACATPSKALKPEIIKIEPTSGPTYGNYSLFIIGNGFDPKSEITIGGQPVKDVKLGQLFFVTVPPGSAGPADVVITNPDNRRAVLREGFTYQEYPVIKAIKPAEGNTDGGTLVTIRGNGFNEGAVVRFGKLEVEIKLLRKGAIQVLSPTHPAGVVDVTVINPGGFSFILEDAFKYYR